LLLTKAQVKERARQLKEIKAATDEAPGKYEVIEPIQLKAGEIFQADMEITKVSAPRLEDISDTENPAPAKPTKKGSKSTAKKNGK